MPQLKLAIGKYYKYIDIISASNDRYKLKFQFDRALIDEVKNLEGARWNPDEKAWYITNSPRNHFTLDYLRGVNPYAKWEASLQDIKSKRKVLMIHQKDMFQIGMTYRQVILAAEPGCISGDTEIIINSITLPIKEAYKLYRNPLTFYSTKCYNGKDTFVTTPALNIIYKGIRSTVIITTELGKKLCCTHDHKILTDRGYVPASCLQPLPYQKLITIDGYEIIRSYEEGPFTDVYDLVCDDPYHNFIANGIVVHNCGKTLSAIEIMEASGFHEWAWVGPKSALRAVEQEFDKWHSLIYPDMMTYDGLKKLVGTNFNYKGICFDEAQKLRHTNTQRFQAAQIICNNIRGREQDPFILELTGSPAPNNPSDWWGLAEIVCPGFLREPNPKKFKERLALIKQEENQLGAWFPKLITYWNDENKCKICGQYQNALEHDPASEVLGYSYHEYQKSKNEVEALYHRLKGLVGIWKKKDVLKELPDKIYRVIKCTPSPEVLRAAKLIVANAKNAMTAGILLRELSDGFQYQNVPVGMMICPLCHGRKTIIHQDVEQLSSCPSCEGVIQYESGKGICVGCSMEFEQEYKENEEYECPNCGGEGEVPKTERQANQVDCPKEDIIKELLDEFDEQGRLVIYAGFTGSVDRCVDIVKKEGWEWMCVDGRGWRSSLENVSDGYMLRMFQDKTRKIPRFCYIGQPDAGGLGLTLTETLAIIYYSNSWLPESRIQSEERGHRPGMDLNKGLTIIDLFHLPSDEKILESLKQSKKLQDMTLGEFSKVFD